MSHVAFTGKLKATSGSALYKQDGHDRDHREGKAKSELSHVACTRMRGATTESIPSLTTESTRRSKTTESIATCSIHTIA